MLGQTTRGGSDDNTIWLQLNAKTGHFVHDLPRIDTGEKGPDGKPKFDYPKESFTEIKDSRVARIRVTEKENIENPAKMDKIVNVSLVGADGTKAVVRATLNDLTMKMLGLLYAADLTKPLTLNLGAFEAGTEDRKKNPATGKYDGEVRVRKTAEPWLTATQGGTKIRAKFTDDGSLPPRVDNLQIPDPLNPGHFLEKTMRDTRRRDAFILELAAKVDVAAGNANKSTPAPTAAPAPAPTEPVAGDDDVYSPDDILGAEHAPAAG